MPLATIFSYFALKKEKLKARFFTFPKDFHYKEVVKLLKYYEYEEVKKGKTSGSRVLFKNKRGDKILLHKPHPSGIMKKYQLKQIAEKLEK